MKKTGLVLGLALAAAAPVWSQMAAPAKDSAEANQILARPRLGAGYLAPEAWPDSLALLSKPPAEGSHALRRDQRLQARAVALQSTARWAQARTDADIFLPNATATMACAAGLDISPITTPVIDKLLRRTMSDFGGATAKAKAFYKRPRPFTVNNQPQCTPDWDKVLRADGSYPSGHAAIGYGWGLTLAAILPGRTSALLKRGRAFAESRRYCNVHWQSDVEAGIAVSTAVYAKLKVDPAFENDLATARAEARQTQAKPKGCDTEKAALAIH
jgi:acid phosphatase (class A)